MTVRTIEKLEKLKQYLQGLSPKQFEELVASLISDFLQVPIFVARSGFQFGADAGTAGAKGRYLRIECKKYSSTVINDRELRGEIDDSLIINDSLEAWILASTQALTLQSADKLNKKSEDVGVPIIVIDWQSFGFPALAALCSASPAIIESYISKEAQDLVESLIADSIEAVNQLRSNLDSWSVGVNKLSKISHQKLKVLWNSARESNAYFGQNIAGGQAKIISRESLSSGLSTWYKTSSDEPVAILGNEGVGKTWATVSWLLTHADELPIALLIPSSNSFQNKLINEAAVIEILADRLSELAKSQRSKQHWLKRVELLFKRPLEEGPTFILLIDGLNQEPSVAWTNLFKILQGEAFAGRIKVIFTSRNLFFSNKLHDLRGLTYTPTRIQVADYDDSKGGELDQKLALEGLTREDFQPDLLDLAKNPRLFNLVLNLKESLSSSTAITVHRLLWEYGKDSLGNRSVDSFSESEWLSWLKTMAKSFSIGIKKFSTDEIVESTRRPYLTINEVQARMSDIIDGNFIEENPISGEHEFIPRMVAHALGLALFTDMSSASSDSFDDYESRLNAWLDPISGLDERSEVLRASVAILLIKSSTVDNRLAGALVAAWLNTQNLPNSHREELVALAPELIDPLLDTIEYSSDYAQKSTRIWALNALVGIPKDHSTAHDLFIARSCKWLESISLDIPFLAPQKEEEEYNRKRITNLLGNMDLGEKVILGKKFNLSRNSYNTAINHIPSLLEGRPLVKIAPVLELAAISIAVNVQSTFWNNLKWLLRLNEIDPAETTIVLRKLSSDLNSRIPETGINERLASRSSALILWLSLYEADELDAERINDNFHGYETYTESYLSSPAHSYYRLEWRHAKEVMLDPSIMLRVKLNKIQKFILDPRFEIPDEFKAEVEKAGKFVDVSQLDTGFQYTLEDHNFELLELALARSSPKRLAQVMRKKLGQMNNLPPESRFRRAVTSNEQLILAGKKEKEAAKYLRSSGHEEDEGREWIASTYLFKIELHDKSALTQAETILEANVENISIDLDMVLRNLTVEESVKLVVKYGDANQEKIAILLYLLIGTPVSESEIIWNWLISLADGENIQLRKLSFRNLALASSERFGQYLLSKQWTWGIAKEEGENQYGSLALIHATKNISFEKVAHLIAPWLIPSAIRVRGTVSEDIVMAIAIINRVVLLQTEDLPELGANITIDQSISEQYLRAKQIKPIESLNIEDYIQADHKVHMERYKHSINVAMTRIDEARKSGASFYVFSFAQDDLNVIIEHASKEISLWLEGIESLSPDFRKRVNLSSSFYISLCEALLKVNPELGTKLWRALQSVLHSVQFNGEAGVLTLLHMLFRSPQSQQLSELREEILDPKYSQTDMDLYCISLAAILNGQSQWLDEVILKDKQSQFPWRNKRSIVLKGFTINNRPSVQNTWPDKQLISTDQKLNSVSAFRRNIQACNKHWWDTYMKSTTPEEAYAAWLLFINTADRRVWEWYPRNHTVSESNTFERLKLLHANLNVQELDRLIKEHEKSLSNKFLGLDLPTSFSFWGTQS